MSSTPNEYPHTPDSSIPAEECPAPAWAGRHIWQFQPVRDVLIILAIVGLVWLGYKLSVVTVPLLLALALAYLCEPLVRKLIHTTRMKRRSAAVAIIFTVAVLLLVPVTLGLIFGIGQGADFFKDIGRLATYYDTFIEAPLELGNPFDPETGDFRGFPALDDPEAKVSQEQREAAERARKAYDELNSPWLQSGANWLWELKASEAKNGVRSDLLVVIDRSTDWFKANAAIVGTQAVGKSVDAAQALLRTVTSVGYIVFALFLTAFFFFFISSSYGRVIESSRKFVPDEHKERVFDLASKMDAVIAGFIRGRLTIAFIQSILFTIAYALIGVPAPIFLGILVGILSIVPYLALVGIPLSIIGLFFNMGDASGFQAEWWWMIGAPLAVYFGLQALDDYVWTPLIQGKATNMDTPTILFATLAGGALGGFFGLLLAIPVAACVKILLKEVFWPRFQEWVHGERRDFMPL